MEKKKKENPSSEKLRVTGGGGVAGVLLNTYIVRIKIGRSISSSWESLAGIHEQKLSDLLRA